MSLDTDVMSTDLRIVREHDLDRDWDDLFSSSAMPGSSSSSDPWERWETEKFIEEEAAMVLPKERIKRFIQKVKVIREKRKINSQYKNKSLHKYRLCPRISKYYIFEDMAIRAS